MTRTVLGIFSDRNDAEETIASLEEAGFMPKDISIVMKDTRENEEFAEDTGTSVAGGAVTGATTGAALGGLAGLLIGLGTITIPGIGALLIGGPLAAALGLTGAAATTVSGAATGALAGGLLGALTMLGLPEKDARLYEERIKEGGILIAIPAATSQYTDVKEILEDHGADQIRSVSSPEASDELEKAMVEPSYQSSSYAHMGAKGGKTQKKTHRK